MNYKSNESELKNKMEMNYKSSGNELKINWK
jgi:hypothetical protein